MKNDELLGVIHKNAEMGLLTVPKIMEKSNDPEFSKCLYKKEKEYSRIYDATKQAADMGFDKEAKLGTFEKLRTEIMIDLNTVVNASVSHLAEMMVVGSTMGVVELTRKLREADSTPATRDLAADLINMEEKSIEELKRFL